jgi:pyruvate dehydrogenase kinase 2/3/4
MRRKKIGSTRFVHGPKMVHMHFFFAKHRFYVCPSRGTPNVIMYAKETEAPALALRYGDAPEVTMHGRLDLTFSYVPTHLHYILLELLKNSMRATIEFHGTENPPPIRSVV